MTSTFAPEYWRQPRDDWKRLGLHWHCFSWVGDGKSLAADGARRDSASELPPLVVRAWLNKPQRVLRQSPATPEDAVAWLRREFDRHAVQMAGTQATDVPEEIRWGTALYDLCGGNDISWGFWLAGGASFVSMAVVGTSECRLHS